ncbi:MAG: hypothetical protein IPJ65_32250 [Archangiaceae bacterium]|nr:hypothetical protein [Archangiaceae bacterium]
MSDFQRALADGADPVVEGLPQVDAAVGDGVVSEAALVLLGDDAVCGLRCDVVEVLDGHRLPLAGAKEMGDGSRDLEEVAVELPRDLGAAFLLGRLRSCFLHRGHALPPLTSTQPISFAA